MRTGDGIPAGRVADGQEHEARRPHAAGVCVQLVVAGLVTMIFRV